MKHENKGAAVEPAKPPVFTLNARQLRAALEFIAPDFDADEDQRDTEISMQMMPERMSLDNELMPAGLYAWDSDYPEEGCIQLCEDEDNFYTAPSPAVAEPAVLFNATEAMIDAALKVDWSNDGDVRGVAHNVWNAMCAAMPARKAIDAQGAEVPRVFLQNLHYFCAQIDGTYKWPAGMIGDLLKQAKREIEASPLPAATLGKADSVQAAKDSVALLKKIRVWDDIGTIKHGGDFHAELDVLFKAVDALAQQPAASEVRDADMFWLFGDGDQTFNDLESACDYLDVGNGDILEFECAMRLPNIKVRIDTGLPLGYEIIATHPASSTAAKGEQKP